MAQIITPYIIDNTYVGFFKKIKKPLNDYFKKFNIMSQNHLVLKRTHPYKSLSSCLYIFIDITKAFDTFSHSLLLETLQNIGVIKLFKRFLFGWSQVVKVNDKLSNENILEYGVLQGSLLFNVFINASSSWIMIAVV